MRCFRTLALAFAVLLSIGSLAPAALVWYGTDTTNPGGDGPWDGTPLWHDGVGLVGWGSNGDYAAVFGGSEPTSTVQLTNSIGTLDSMTFNSTGYVITTADTWQSINLNGAGPHFIVNADATVRATLYGSTGLRKTGTGTLTLDGDAVNGFTGGVMIDEGILSFNNINKLANNAVTLGTATTAGGLKYTGATDTYGSTLTLGTATTAGNIIEVATAGADLTWSGIIGGGAAAGNTSLVIKGAGRFIPTATNTFTGNIVVDSGTLAIDGPGGTTDPRALGAAGARNITLTNGGTFELLSSSLNPGGTTKQFIIGAGGGTFKLASGTSLTLDDPGQLSGAGDLSLRGDGLFRADADITPYTGTIRVYGGTLVGLANLPQNLVLAGGTVASNAGGRTFGTVTSTVQITADTTISVNDADGAGVQSVTLPGTLTGSNNLTVTGTAGTGATVAFSGATAGFTGDITMNAAGNTLQFGRGAAAADLNKPVTIVSGQTVRSTAGLINIYGTGTATHTVGTTIASGAEIIAETAGTANRITVGTSSDNNEFRLQVDAGALIWAKGGEILLSGRASSPATIVGGDLKATDGGKIWIGANSDDGESRISLLSTATLLADGIGSRIELRNRDAGLTINADTVASITVKNGGSLFFAGSNDTSGALNKNVIHEGAWTLGWMSNNGGETVTIAHDASGAAGITDSIGLTLEAGGAIDSTFRYNRPSITIVPNDWTLIAPYTNPAQTANWADGQVKANLVGGRLDIATAAVSTFNYIPGMTVAGWGALGTSTANQSHVIPAAGLTFYATDAAAATPGAATLRIIGTLNETAGTRAVLRVGDADSIWLTVPNVAASPYVLADGQVTLDAQTGTNSGGFISGGGVVTANKAGFNLNGQSNVLRLEVRGGTQRTDFAGSEGKLKGNVGDFVPGGASPTWINAPVRLLSMGSGNSGGTFITTAPTFTLAANEAMTASGSSAGTVWASPDAGVTITQLELDGLVDVGGTGGWTIAGYVQPTSTGIFRLDGGELLHFTAGGDLRGMTLGYTGATGTAVINLNGANRVLTFGKGTRITDNTFTTAFAGTKEYRVTAGTLQMQLADPTNELQIEGTNAMRGDIVDDGFTYPALIGTLGLNGGRFEVLNSTGTGGTKTTITPVGTLSGKGIFGQAANVDTFVNVGTVTATGGTLQIDAHLAGSTDTVQGGITAAAGTRWITTAATDTLVLNGNLSDFFVSGSTPTPYQLVWNQPGKLNLMQTNSYSGGTVVNQGTVSVYAATGLGAGPVLVQNTTAGSAVLQAFTAANALGSAAIDLSTGAELRLFSETSTTFGGALTISDATAKIVTDRITGGTGANAVLSVNSLTVPALTSLTSAAGPNGGIGYLLGVTGTTTLNGGSANTLNGDFTFDTALNSGFYLGAVDAAAGTRLVKKGAGTVVLGGANNFSDIAPIEGGVLGLTPTTALPPSVTSLTFAGGGIGAFGGPVTFSLPINVTGDFAFSGAQPLTLTTALNLGGVNRTITLSNTADVTLQGGFTNFATITTVGTGTGRLVLPGSNTISPLIVNGGVVHVPSAASLSVASLSVGLNTTAAAAAVGTFSVAAGGTVVLGGGPTTNLNIGAKTDAVASYVATGTVDLSAMTSGVTIDVGNINIGADVSGTGSNDANLKGTLKLPAAAVVNTITASTRVVIGESPKSGQPRGSLLDLGGGDTTITTPTFTLGGRKGGGAETDQHTVTIATGGILRLGAAAGGRTDLNIARNNVDTGSNTWATFDMTNGTMIAQLDELVIGERSGGGTTNAGSGRGRFILGPSAANDVNVNTIRLAILSSNTAASVATGELTLMGGTVTVNNGISTSAADTRSTSTINLQGATLDLKGSAIGSATAPIDALNFNSGVLKNVGQINGGGALTLDPTGTLTIAGANTWTGETTIAEGKTIPLAAGTTLGAKFNVGAAAGSTALLDATAGGFAMTGGALQGFGTVLGDVAINAGGAASGGGTGSLGTLTIGTAATGSLTFNAGSSLLVDVDGLGADRVDVLNAAAGAVNFAGATSLKVNPLTGFAAGNYAVLKYGAGGATGVNNLGVDVATLPFGYNAGVVNNTASSQVELSVVEAKRWFGATSGSGPENTAWNIGGTANWKTYVTGTLSPYAETPLRDAVIFDDTAFAVGSTATVNVTTNVAPASLFIDNAGAAALGKDYEFTGVGGIVGGIEVVKRGTGTVKFSNAGNAWTGGTKLQGGTLQNGVANALPTAGALTLGGAATNATYDMNGFAQTLAGLADAGVAANRVVTNSGATATLTLSGAGTHTFGGAINGNVNLVRSGTGTQNLTAASSFAGTTTVQSGTLAVGHDTALSSGPINLTGNSAVLQLGAYLPGLMAGRVGGNNNWTAGMPSPFEIQEGPAAANVLGSTDAGPVAGPPEWVANSTWIYQGQIYIPADGNVSFGKGFDDSFQLKLDGAVVATHTTWNTVSTTTVPLTEGWHNFEVRFGQGTGGVGPAAGWTGFGFGVDLTGSGSTSQSAYVYPTGGSWFRTANTPTLNLMNTIDVAADATVAVLSGVAAGTYGNLNLANNVLTVNGGGALTINGTTNLNGAAPTLNVAAGTRMTLAGLVTDSGAGHKLVKTGGGTLEISTSYDNTFSGGVEVNAGKLVVTNGGGNATGTGPLTVAAGATLGGGLYYGAGIIGAPVTVNGTVTGGDLGAVGTLTVNNTLTFTSTANAVIDIASLGSYDQFLGLTGVTFGGTLTVAGSPAEGVYQVFNIGGATGGTDTFASIVTPTGFAGTFDRSNGQLTLSAVVGPLTRTWTGLALGADSNVGTAGNWDSGAPATGDHIVFAAGNNGKTSPVNEAARTVGNVTFDAASYNLGGTEKLSATGAVTANQNATISAPLELAGGSLAAASGATLTVSGSVSGTQGLTKAGLGLVELTAAANTYTGNTLVNEGTLKVNAGIDLNAPTDDTIVGTGTPGSTATLITDHVRQDTLTINADSKVQITGTTTSVVNFLQIANGSGGFAWDAGSGGSAPAGATGGGVNAVPEPATWLLAVIAALAGLVAWRRRR